MDSINLFFQYLSERKYKETDLSDIIFSACNASQEFFQLFIGYIFDGNYHTYSDLYMSREITSDDKISQIDFRIEDKLGNTIYLIENKINDQDTHYPKYLSSFPGIVIGFIANYEVDEIEHYKFSKTWKGFYDLIKNKIQNKIITDIELCNGVAEYIRGVCGLMSIEKFNITKTESLDDLNNYLKSLVNQKSECELLGNRKSIESNRHGVYFRFHQMDIWFGIYTASYSHNLLIGLQKKSNPDLFNDITISKISQGKYFDKPYEEYDEYWFELKADILYQLSIDDLEVDDKLRLIKNFYEEVLSIISTIIKS